MKFLILYVDDTIVCTSDRDTINKFNQKNLKVLFQNPQLDKWRRMISFGECISNASEIPKSPSRGT